MRKFIYNTNQYLLERFPTIWNTRIVWMLLIALTLHVIFFVFGFLTLSNVKLMHDYRIIDIFFENGTVFLNTIISILLIVVWLIYMFKNNAFKNFYPMSGTKLFGQFVAYFVIIFSCTTFFLSYNYGIKSYIATTYPLAQTNKHIEISNDAAMFLSESLTNFTLDKRRYPKPFYDLYCDVRTNQNKDSLYALTFLNQEYRFYTLSTKKIPIEETYTFEDSSFQNYVYYKTIDSLRIYYYKDSLVNPVTFVKSAKPTYYNASFTFFKSKNDTLVEDAYSTGYDDYDYSYDYDYTYSPDFTIRHQLRNKRNYELLERQDKTEISHLLEDFLTLSNLYKIDHNLTTEAWLALVYHPENFEVKNFIRTEPADRFDTDYSNIDVYDIENSDLSQLDLFHSKHLTDFYYDNDQLFNVFHNIEDIKQSNPFMESIHFFMWFSFFLSCIIFMFRVTGLKALLFTIITTGVLMLFVTLLTVVTSYIFQGRGDIETYFAMYLTFLLGSVILAIPLFFRKAIKKLIVGICLNITMVGFGTYILLIIGIISMHQYDYCSDHSIDQYSDDCSSLITSLGVNWSFVIFGISLLFLYFYSKIIKSWKALPES